jgi:hypothetical protein
MLADRCRNSELSDPGSQTPVWEPAAGIGVSSAQWGLETAFRTVRSQTGVWERDRNCNRFQILASLFGVAVLLATGLLVSQISPLRAADDDSRNEPPVVGRPAGFTGAIGTFKITVRAEPTKVVAEEPLTLTVRITGTGELKTIKRPDLARMPKFAKSFQVEDLGERLTAEEMAVEFDYRIRPRNSNVKQIPALPFVYYRSGFIPPSNGYQTTYSSVIPLTVELRPSVSSEEVKGGKIAELRDPPETLMQVVHGDKVLRRQEDESWPGPGICTIAILLPPICCAGWYLLWLRQLPAAERLARRRRSRAAELALNGLRQASRMKGVERAHKAEAIVREFLRGRCDVRTLEPTGSEVAHHLRRLGYSDSLAEMAADIFTSSDAFRFSPNMTGDPAELTMAAHRFIVALEAESCTRSA